MFNPRYDDVHLRPFQACALFTLRQSPKGFTARDLASAIYGDSPPYSRVASSNNVLRELVALKLCSLHYAPRESRTESRRGAKAVSVYAPTHLGIDWLRHHPEASTAFTPRGLGKPRKQREAPAMVMAIPAPVKITSLNLKRYAHRPLPLRVRKAAGMPAHFWR
jgi:hypothetical protein